VRTKIQAINKEKNLAKEKKGKDNDVGGEDGLLKNQENPGGGNETIPQQ